MSDEVRNEVKLPTGKRLVLSSSPHISTSESVRKIMLKVLLAMLPACAAGVWFFGLRALWVIVFTTSCCVGAEALWCAMTKKPVLPTIRDCSAAVTGVLLALNLPPGVPFYVPLIGAFLAIWLGKQIFGGLGHNPFNPALVARVLDEVIPPPDARGIPAVMLDLVCKRQGLILVTGPTGSGKSTTLASLLDFVNHRKHSHIITIEDPIEFVYNSDCSVIEQREVHADTLSFAEALRAALRQTPDIIMVGELRDNETIAAALTAAETGHLVLGTIHTNSAAQTVDRVIDSFPQNMQNQIRQQFASSLLAVVSQRLLRRADGMGRVAAFEIMVATTPIRALIRESRGHQIEATMETGWCDGMQTMRRALDELLEKGLITEEAARSVTV